MVTRAAGGGAMAPGSPGEQPSLGNMNWELMPCGSGGSRSEEMNSVTETLASLLGTSS